MLFGVFCMMSECVLSWISVSRTEITVFCSRCVAWWAKVFDSVLNVL